MKITSFFFPHNMKNEFMIRDYQQGDFQAINQLWQDTGMGGSVRGDNETVIEQTLLAGGKLLVLEHTSTRKIAGTSWLTNDQRRIYLHHFGISPEFQGQGLSHLLVRESLDFAKKKGLQIKLEVHRNNTKAISLYEKSGFAFLGDYLVYIIRDLSSV
jgi:ribosomal protein S18 acetylase RimI-like enzyme